ncbi:methyltransferase domain-containing protein [Sulfurovum sp.]|uniref:methyltransferase domain-containing protein n=1 Tax=Sulfurovum sp. TaxID=1969726 RepID=UPI0025DAC0C2|nr:methyltransferase domain-containing protein [Sulfurovum sp.]
MPTPLKINNIKGIECVLYHLTDARLTPQLAEYYKKHLKDKFVFNAGELKRTQFCLDLAKSVIGEETDCTVADIGPGRRLFTALMCEEGYSQVTAVDMCYYEGCEIENDNFSFLNSTIENMEESYDYTFCFEVLEHNKLSLLEKNIDKIKSITNKKAVISLPYYEDPVTTKGHCFTLDTEMIHQYFQGSKIYLLYRETGFSYIFFVFDCESTL